MGKFTFLFTAIVGAWFYGPAAHAQDIAGAFHRGMGMSHVMAWAPVEAPPSKSFVFPPFSYPDAAFNTELRALLRTGFDFIRFAVDPGPFLQSKDSRRDYLERMLIGRVRQVLSCGLAIIVDFHPSDMHPDYLAEKIAAGADAPLFRDYLGLLARTAASLDALQSSRVALEIMNEPPPAANAWRPMLDAAYRAIRNRAPKLLLVLDGGQEGNLDGTIQLDGFGEDPNILFSFHYYRPWQFTHQGLAGMAAQYFTDVPYPARARPMEESIHKTAVAIAHTNLAPSQKLLAEGAAHDALESYRASSFDRTAIKADFDKMALWARHHSVPMNRVILGEFGAMNNAQRGLVTRQDERLRWLTDVRQEAEAHGFVWAAWVYSGSLGFSLAKHVRAPELDTGVARALGLE